VVITMKKAFFSVLKKKAVYPFNLHHQVLVTSATMMWLSVRMAVLTPLPMMASLVVAVYGRAAWAMSVVTMTSTVSAIPLYAATTTVTNKDAE
jgi:cellulose synthase/poly-beta-1,6-N-acetylglucosamine synthase-like glycosyltransferase